MSKTRTSTARSFVVTLCLLVLFVTPGAVAASAEQGVFEYVVEQATGAFDEIATDLEAAAAAGGWEVLSARDAGTPDGCDYRARVFILLDREYAVALHRANGMTGAYSALDRVNLFEDEAGTHVSVVNTRSLNRTILMEDEAHAQLSQAHLARLRGLIGNTVRGTKSERQYGQVRERGLIGKTMGVVAGGKFGDLIKEIASVEGGNLAEVVAKLEKGLAKKGKKWGLELTHSVDLPGLGVAILGTTGAEMERKSFKIVGAGTDEARKEYSCPGTAYAAAYPIEIVVTLEDGDVKVRMVEAMFRMKMYFEDAGKISFMKNMKMPGSLAKELRKQVKEGLKG